MHRVYMIGAHQLEIDTILGIELCAGKETDPFIDLHFLRTAFICTPSENGIHATILLSGCSGYICADTPSVRLLCWSPMHNG